MPPAESPAPGLCARCRHASVQYSAKGSAFWRCRRADRDPAYLRYPPLPVLACPGHEAGRPERRGAGPGGETG